LRAQPPHFALFAKVKAPAASDTVGVVARERVQRDERVPLRAVRTLARHDGECSCGRGAVALIAVVDARCHKISPAPPNPMYTKREVRADAIANRLRDVHETFWEVQRIAHFECDGQTGVHPQHVAVRIVRARLALPRAMVEQVDLGLLAKGAHPQDTLRRRARRDDARDANLPALPPLQLQDKDVRGVGVRREDLHARCGEVEVY
jgi:hypothetical protein